MIVLAKAPEVGLIWLDEERVQGDPRGPRGSAQGSALHGSRDLLQGARAVGIQAFDCRQVRCE